MRCKLIQLDRNFLFDAKAGSNGVKHIQHEAQVVGPHLKQVLDEIVEEKLQSNNNEKERRSRTEADKQVGKTAILAGQVLHYFSPIGRPAGFQTSALS